MLARKYDNYAWQEQPAEQHEAPQPVRRRRRKPDKMKLIRSGLFKIMAVVMVAYFAMVLRSEAMVQCSNELVSLQKQEAQLINQNNELRIEVEQLKAPERIIGLAEQRLGMSVARSNIYVRAGEAAKSSNSLAAK